MIRLSSVAEVFSCFRGGATPSRWTAVIPAAGRGTRLAFDRPKILYPILGRSILEWLVALLEPLCGHIVLVLSPDGVAHVAPHAQRLLPERLEIATQELPRGMADAVANALPMVRTPYTLVVWGDQVTLRARTVEACMRAHEGREDAHLTIPTVLRRDPYIHFVRDAQDRLLRVEQAREKPISVEIGENDCGLFLFTTQTLAEEIHRAREDARCRGEYTGEFNLLPLLPRFERGPRAVFTVRLEDADETLGVNSAQDADAAARILATRKVSA